MKVIILNGPMGVGKTTVGKLIAEKCPGTAFIDGDWCMDLHPFVVGNYMKCSACKMIVLVWLMDDPWVLQSLTEGLIVLQAEIRNVTLVCDRENLLCRWENDHTCEWRTDEWLKVSLSSLPAFAAMENTLDTAGLSPERIADLILER